MDRERCSSLLQRALSHGDTSLHERIAETAESHARRSRDGFVFGSPPAVRVNCLFMPAEHAGQEKAPNAARTGPGALALMFAYYRCAPLSAALPCPGGTRMDSSLAVMSGEGDCLVCAEGTFCPVGSANAP